MINQEIRSNHRQREILDELRRSGGSSRIQNIARVLNVSEETVRRNIKRLVNNGVVEKVHGGARLLEIEQEGDLRQRMLENPAAKLRIAEHVASLIKDGSSLFLDIGSTTTYIADALKAHKRLLVITNSVAVAYKLATRNENRVFMVGGELRAHDGGAFGSGAMEFASRFHADYAILSSAAISAENGIMLQDLEEAKFSQMIMKKSGKRIVAADSRKFHTTAPIVVGDPALVDVIVTDEPPPQTIIDAAREWSTEIVVAD